MSLWLKQIYIDDHDYFVVWRERFGSRYFLDVVCGGVGEYERRIELEQEEIEQLRRDPKELRILALRLARWPERYGDRLRAK